MNNFFQPVFTVFTISVKAQKKINNYILGCAYLCAIVVLLVWLTYLHSLTVTGHLQLNLIRIRLTQPILGFDYMGKGDQSQYFTLYLIN